MSTDFKSDSGDEVMVDVDLVTEFDDSNIDDGLDLNQAGGVIEHARRLIARVGWIPTLVFFNTTKAAAMATGVYLIYPGELQEKVLAVGTAVTLDFATSPAAWLMGALIISRTGEKIRDIIKASPKP